MSDLRLRDELERESHRVSLPPHASERMFERRDRRDRRRRAGVIVTGLALFAGVIAIVLFAAPRGEEEPRPAAPTGVVAGTYEARLPARDPDVTRLGLAGMYELRLGAGGTVRMMSPRDVDLPGAPVTFSIEDDVFTTDFLVGSGCDTQGRYRWSADEQALTLTPLDDPCDLRTALLATRPWTSITPLAPTDALQGDWTATFTCEEMVAAVERAPIPPEGIAFFRQGMSHDLGSPDPNHPCAGTPPDPMTQTLRFVDGRLQIFDQTGSEGFDGGYERRGDVLVIRDALTQNIVGSYRLAIDTRPDALVFRLLGQAAKDPFFTGTWEVSPFVRVP